MTEITIAVVAALLIGGVLGFGLGVEYWDRYLRREGKIMDKGELQKLRQSVENMRDALGDREKELLAERERLLAQVGGPDRNSY